MYGQTDSSHEVARDDGNLKKGGPVYIEILGQSGFLSEIGAESPGCTTK